MFGKRQERAKRWGTKWAGEGEERDMRGAGDQVGNGQEMR